MLKNSFFILMVSLLLSTCAKIRDVDMDNLNGYWEIESVQHKGETFYPRGPSPSIDFYSINKKLEGYKKKTTPSIAGKYLSTADIAEFRILLTNEGYVLDYYKAINPWQESLVSINKNTLVLSHSGKTYQYKRHQKIEL